MTGQTLSEMLESAEEQEKFLDVVGALVRGKNTIVFNKGMRNAIQACLKYADRN